LSPQLANGLKTHWLKLTADHDLTISPFHLRQT